MTQSTVSKPMNLLTFLVACGCLFSSTVVPGCFPPPPTNKQDTTPARNTTTNNTTQPVTCSSFNGTCPSDSAANTTECPDSGCDKETCCLQPRVIKVELWFQDGVDNKASALFRQKDNATKIEDTKVFEMINSALGGLSGGGYMLSGFQKTAQTYTEEIAAGKNATQVKTAFGDYLKTHHANDTGVFNILVLKDGTVVSGDSDKHALPDFNCICTGGCFSIWKTGTALQFLNHVLRGLETELTTTPPPTTTTIATTATIATTTGSTSTTPTTTTTIPGPNSLAALESRTSEWKHNTSHNCLRPAPRTSSSGLSPYALGGIVAGGLFAIAVLSYVVVRAKKSGNDKADKEKVPINGGIPGTRKTNGGGRHPPRRAIE